MSLDPDLDSHPDSDPAASPVARRLAVVGRSAVEGVRRAAADGAAQLVAWDLKLPRGASRMRQFVFGFWLPVVVARFALVDARVRARWLRFGVAQAVVTVLVAVLALSLGGSDGGGGNDKAVSQAAQDAVAELRHRVEDRAAELEGRAAPVDRALVRAQRELVNARLERVGAKLEGHGASGIPAPDELPIFVSRALNDGAMEREAALQAELAAADGVDGEKLKVALEEKVGELFGGGRGAAAEEKPSFDLAEAKALNARKLQQEILKKAQARAIATDEPGEAAAAQVLKSALKRSGAGPAVSPEQAAKARRIRAELKAAAMAAVPAAEQKLVEARPWSSRLAALGVSWRILGWLVALWGALYGAQFVVIALCRDFHSELSREACLLTGIAPEDPPRAPRPRIDLRWAVLRVKRQLRGWWVITLGIPVCYLIGLAFPGDSVRNALVAGWLLYWQAVFAASKSQRAWVDEHVAPAPWFLRGWRWLCDKVLPFRLLGAGVYLGIWERSTRSLYAPAECVEQQPAPFAGLMCFRLLGSTPLVKIFVRPLIPVASALLIEAYREHHPARTAPPVLMAEPVVAPAPAAAS